MVAATVIATVLVRATGEEATVAFIARTGVRTGVNGTHPIPPIPKTVSGSITATSPTIIEIDQSDQRVQGVRFGGDVK